MPDTATSPDPQRQAGIVYQPYELDHGHLTLPFLRIFPFTACLLSTQCRYTSSSVFPTFRRMLNSMVVNIYLLS